jgi:signal transduction histidine kinase
MSVVSTPFQSPEHLNQRVRERHLLAQIDRIVLIGILLLVVVVYIIIPVETVGWFEHPFVGTLLASPLTAVPDVTNQALFTGNPILPEASPLAEGETIISVDGEPVTSTRSYYRALDRFSVGDTVTLDVRGLQGATHTVDVTLHETPRRGILGLFTLPYAIGLIFIASGLWANRRRPQAVGRVFLMFCASAALAFGTTFSLWSTHAFTRLWLAAIPWAAGLLAVFALIYPNDLPLVAQHPLLRWLPLLPSAAVLVYGQAALGRSYETFSAVRLTSYVYASIAMVFFLIVQFLRGLYTTSPAAREQSRVVVAGSLLAFAPFLLWISGLTPVPFGWVLLTLLLFPGVLAYSVIRYSLLDTNRMVSFAATYTIMAVVVTLGYALFVAGINAIASALFLDSMSVTNPVLVGLLAFVLVLVFQPLRRNLQNTIDGLFFQSGSGYGERLSDFRHQLTLASGLDEVVRLLKQQIREGVLPTHTYVFLRDPHSGEFLAVGEGSRPDTDIRFEPQSGIIHALSTTRDVIFIEFNKPLPPEMLEDHARLAIIRTPVLVPLQGQDRLAGFIAVGPKRSGQPFDIRDLRFMQGIAEQGSLAVERAQVISDLERRVRELDVLSQVAQAVNFTTDPDALLELIYTQSSKLIDTTNFYIVVHNPEVQGLEFVFFLEGDERFREREGEYWSDHEGLTAEVVRTGLPIRTDDYAAECSQRGVTARPTRQLAWMGVPLNAGARTLGVMIVASYVQGVTFTEDQAKIFWAIADQAATALDKTRLFNETETRARQLATLNEISRELSSTLDLENLLGRIMRSAVDIIGTEAGSLLLMDENTGQLIYRVVEGGMQNLVGTRLSPGIGATGQAVEAKEPVIVNSVLQDQSIIDEADTGTVIDTQSLLAVPMLIQDEAIGVLEVINRKDQAPFDDDDASLLATFASQAAIAIDNARLYEATDAELARRIDELQHLQRIDRELNRTLQLDRVIHITLEWAMRITGAAAGYVGILNPDDTGLDILAANGYTESFLARLDDAPLPIEGGPVGRVMRSGEPEFGRRADGQPYEPVGDLAAVASIVVPIMRANRPVGVLALESDIPDLLTYQDFDFAQRLVEHAAVAIENARLVQEVQDANLSKTEFVSFVAHELKNPMTSIRGYTDLLRGGQVGDVNEMQVQFLSTIRSNVDRMSRLVSDLADIARLETGHLRLEMEPTAVAEVIEEALSGLHGQIEEKEQVLALQIEDDLPPIHADPTRMVQVLTNLISNANKYTPEGGRIEIGAQVSTATDKETGERQIVVHHWVTDTGIGLTEDDMEQLFGKFFRTERGKDMASGTGLGLNITKSLVERHGGEIWVESEAGAGSTFHYIIPAAAEGAAESGQDDT